MLYPEVHAALNGLAEAYDRFTQNDPARGRVDLAPSLDFRTTDIGIVLSDTAMRFLATSDAESKGRALLQSAAIGKMLDDRGVARVVDAVWYNVAIPFLHTLVRRQGGFSFQADQFESLYIEFEAFLSRGSDEYMLRAPLRNFEMQEEPLVAAGMTLRRLTRDEFTIAFLSGRWSCDEARRL